MGPYLAIVGRKASGGVNCIPKSWQVCQHSKAIIKASGDHIMPCSCLQWLKAARQVCIFGMDQSCDAASGMLVQTACMLQAHTLLLSQYRSFFCCPKGLNLNSGRAPAMIAQISCIPQALRLQGGL